MNNLELELVDLVVKLAAARKLRERHFRELRALRDSGADSTQAERALGDNKDVIHALQQRRKEVAAELIRSDFRRHLRSRKKRARTAAGSKDTHPEEFP
jgi:Mg2+ and Co2+ transporter CorA